MITIYIVLYFLERMHVLVVVNWVTCEQLKKSFVIPEEVIQKTATIYDWVN